MNRKSLSFFGRFRLAALAFAFPALAASAAPTLTAPADYATLDQMTPFLKSFAASADAVSTATYKTAKTTARAQLADEYFTNQIPVRLVWSGTSGTSTLTIQKTHGGVVLTTNLTATSFDFVNPEVGYNYTWTVKNGSASASRHFFVARTSPRILNGQCGAAWGSDIDNARDIGGWTNTSGQVVRQGLLYRSFAFDFFHKENNPNSVPYFSDVLGIRTDVDLRELSAIHADAVKYGIADNVSPLADKVVRFTAEFAANGHCFGSYGAMVTSNGYRRAFGHVFTNLTNAATLPAVFHCAHGKDRTGSLAYVLNGMLGVPVADLRLDWAYSYIALKDKTISSFLIDGLKDALNTRYKSQSTVFATQCELYVKECLTDIGLSSTAAASQVAAFKAMMLETAETPDTNPSGVTLVAVPSLSSSSVAWTGSAVDKPTVAASSYYTADAGTDKWIDAGHYVVTVTLTDPVNTRWADGTTAPKELDFKISALSSSNYTSGRAVQPGWIKGQTPPQMWYGHAKHGWKTTQASRTQASLANLAPGTYKTTFSVAASDCWKAASDTVSFTVYPETEKAVTEYEWISFGSPTICGAFDTGVKFNHKTTKIEYKFQKTTDDAGVFVNAGDDAVKYSYTLMLYSEDGFILMQPNYNNVKLAESAVARTNLATHVLVSSGTGVTYDGKALKYSYTMKDETTKHSLWIGTGYRYAEQYRSPWYGIPHRFYYLKMWSGNGTTLIHHWVPVKTSSGAAMLYDKVTEQLLPPFLTGTDAFVLGGTATPIGGGGADAPTLTAPADGANVAILNATHKWYYGKTLAQRQAIDAKTTPTNADRQKLINEGTCYPVKTTFSWSGTGPFDLLIRRASDQKTFLATNGLSVTSLAVDNFEIGTAYEWTVSNADGAAPWRTFVVESMGPRLLNGASEIVCTNIWGAGKAWEYRYTNATPHGVRDLGGYIGLNGLRGRQGMILRSSQLNAEGNGQSFITARNSRFWKEFIGIKTEIDLRNNTEAGNMTKSPLGTGVTYKRFTGMPSDAKYMQNTTYLTSVKGAVQLFAKAENYPIDFHCVHGKDRTGTLALLIEGLLGYDEDVIVKDYEATMFWNPTQPSERFFGIIEYMKTNRWANASAPVTLNAGISNYVRKAGVSAAEITAIRNIMLTSDEPAPVVHEHDWSAWTTNVAPTCTTSGSRSRTCGESGCTESPQTETLAALGHALGAWTVVREPTETVPGLKKRVCTRTGCTFEETEEIPVVAPTVVTTFDWLETDGKGYIITDYVPNGKKTRVEMKFRLLDLANDAALFMGASTIATLKGETATSDNEFGSIFWSDSKSFQYYCDPAGNVSYRTYFADTNHAHTVVAHGASVSFDGAAATLSGTASDVSAGGPLALFVTSFGKARAEAIARMRVQYIRIEEITGTTTNLVRDWVAATNTAGVATLYDRVTKTFETVRGTGAAFTVGNGLDPDPVPDKRWTGKTVSVLGDSYSTWAGLQYVTNSFYPDTKSKVTAMSQLWWQQLIEHYDGTLGQIVAGGGSRISGDCIADGKYPMGSYLNRSKNGELGDPDVLFVLGGLNDHWAGVSTDDFATGCDALFDMLDTRYEKAEKIVPLLKLPETWDSGLPSDYRSILRTLATNRGYTVVDLLGAYEEGAGDISDGHPSAKGMTNIFSRIVASLEGVYEPPTHVHLYGDWVTNVVPSVGHEGQRTKTCVADGCCWPLASVVETLPPLGPAPVIDPTQYGAKDTASVTYTWLDGVSGPWEYTTNWTSSAATCYGIPNAAVATAVFPATLPAGTQVTVTNTALDVKKIDFRNTASLTFCLNGGRIQAAIGTASDRTTLEIGRTGPTSVEFRGLRPQLKARSSDSFGRLVFGTNSTEVAYGTVLTFVPPSAGWPLDDPPLLSTGENSNITFYPNVSFIVDAVHVPAPGAGQSVTNVLASNPSDGIRVEEAALASANILHLPAKTTGRLFVANNALYFVVTSDEAPPAPVRPEVETFDWLETDGKGYIVTDYVPNTGRTRVEMRLQFLSLADHAGLAIANGGTGQTTGGDEAEWGAAFIASDTTPGSGTFYYYCDAGSGDVGGSFGAGFADTTGIHTLAFGAGITALDGVTNVTTAAENQFASGPLALFALNWGSKTYQKMIRAKCRAIRVWEIVGTTETLVRDWVPATNETGVATLYDRVTASFEAVSGTGAHFTVGNDVPGTGPTEVAKPTLAVAWAKMDGTNHKHTIAIEPAGAYTVTYSNSGNWTAAGSYTATCHLTDTTKYVWTGSETGDVVLTFAVVDTYDYLDTDGNGYLVTDYPLNIAKTKAEMTFQLLEDQPEGDQCLFWLDNQTTGEEWGCTQWDKGGNIEYYYEAGSVTAVSRLSDCLDIHVIRAGGNRVRFDGGVPTSGTAAAPTALTATGNVMLFASRNCDTHAIQRKARMRLWGFKIWEDSEAQLLRNYVPAKNLAGVGTLFDTVTCTYLNPATGTFTVRNVEKLGAPSVETAFDYDSTMKRPLAAGSLYALGGDTAACVPGDYTVTVKPRGGYVWQDGSRTVQSYAWCIDGAFTKTTRDWGWETQATIGGKRYGICAFTQSANWTVPTGVSSLEFLVVAGGGAGGASGESKSYRSGGGGGAGGVVTGRVDVAAGSTLTLTVGAGGMAVSGAGQQGSDGGDSILANGGVELVLVKGGGAGGYATSGGMAGKAGGNGGGSACAGTQAGGVVTAPTVAGGIVYATFGHAGGKCYSTQNGGGGGGAGGAGGTATSSAAGAGGDGITLWITGEEAVYARGGTGGFTYNDNQTTVGAEAASTGNGGMGAYRTSSTRYAPATGGSGLVVVRYEQVETPEPEPVDTYDYLTTDGNGYIDTGIRPNVMTTRVRAAVRFRDLTVNGAKVAFQEVGNRNWGLAYWVDGSSGSLQYYCSSETGDYGVSASSDFQDAMTVHTFDMCSNVIMMDGVAHLGSLNESDYSEVDGTLQLFSRFGTNPGLSADVYYVQIITNNVLARDFVPAKDPTSGAATLYDKVNQEYMTVQNYGTTPTFSVHNCEKIDVPAVPVTTFVYDGTEKRPLVPQAGDHFSALGDATAVIPGNYTLSIVPDSGYTWQSGTRDPITVNWTITGAWDPVATAYGYSNRVTVAGQDYCILAFTNTASAGFDWTVPKDVASFDFLVVAGGGGGGAGMSGHASYVRTAGGGGAGGVVTGVVANAAGTFTVKVGAGGARGASYGANGAKGGDSSLTCGGANYVTAKGGGYGGGARWTANTTAGTGNSGGDGGSGGGGSSKYSSSTAGGKVETAVIGAGVTAWESFGSAGGAGYSKSYAGGGGGAGGAGESASSTNKKNGDGGAGIVLLISGVPATYACGGGTARRGAADDGAAAAPSTGNGGAGGHGSSDGAGYYGEAGGSGIVIIRYAVGSAVDPIQKKVDDAKSGGSVLPTGVTLGMIELAENGKSFKYGGKTYTKLHYVFRAADPQLIALIAPEEADITSAGVGASGKFVVGAVDPAVKGFYYTAEYATEPNATVWTVGTSAAGDDKPLVLEVDMGGNVRFYRLVVTDVAP